MHKEFKEFYIMTFVQYLCPTDTRASKRADNIFGHQKLWYNMKQQVFPCTCAGAIKVFWEMTCFQSKNWFVSLSLKSDKQLFIGAFYIAFLSWTGCVDHFIFVFAMENQCF